MVAGNAMAQVASVLNGLALLFIVEFDEKTYELLVSDSHNKSLSGEIKNSRNVAIILEEKRRATYRYSVMQVIVAALVAYMSRTVPDTSHPFASFFCECLPTMAAYFDTAVDYAFPSAEFIANISWL